MQYKTMAHVNCALTFHQGPANGEGPVIGGVAHLCRPEDNFWPLSWSCMLGLYNSLLCFWCPKIIYIKEDVEIWFSIASVVEEMMPNYVQQGNNMMILWIIHDVGLLVQPECFFAMIF